MTTAHNNDRIKYAMCVYVRVYFFMTCDPASWAASFAASSCAALSSRAWFCPAISSSFHCNSEARSSPFAAVSLSSASKSAIFDQECVDQSNRTIKMKNKKCDPMNNKKHVLKNRAQRRRKTSTGTANPIELMER